MEEEEEEEEDDGIQDRCDEREAIHDSSDVSEPEG